MAKRCRTYEKISKKLCKTVWFGEMGAHKTNCSDTPGHRKILLSGLMLGKNDQIKITYHAYTLKSAEQAYYLKSCGYINYSDKIGRNR